MKRYLRLYAYFIRFSASRSMEFRLDFYFRVFMDLAYYGVALGFFHILFLHVESVAGWNLHQMRVFVAAYILVDALHMTVFSDNLWLLPGLVNKGDLDYYLVRPVAPLFFLSLRSFAFNSFLNLVCAVAIAIWALITYPDPIGPARLAAFLALILAGSLLYYCVHLLTILPVFWTQSGETLHGLFYNMTRFMERPDRIYRGWVRVLLTVALPFGLMASFPARVLIEPFDPAVTAQMLGVLVLFFGITLWVWNRGLRAYASASS